MATNHVSPAICLSRLPEKLEWDPMLPKSFSDSGLEGFPTRQCMFSSLPKKEATLYPPDDPNASLPLRIT